MCRCKLTKTAQERVNMTDAPNQTIISQLPFVVSDDFSIDTFKVLEKCGKCGKDVPDEAIIGRVWQPITGLIAIEGKTICPSCAHIEIFHIRIRQNGVMDTCASDGSWSSRNIINTDTFLSKIKHFFKKCFATKECEK